MAPFDGIVRQCWSRGTGTLHGFSVSDGDTVKFGKQRIRNKLRNVDPTSDNIENYAGFEARLKLTST